MDRINTQVIYKKYKSLITKHEVNINLGWEDSTSRYKKNGRIVCVPDKLLNYKFLIVSLSYYKYYAIALNVCISVCPSVLTMVLHYGSDTTFDYYNRK